jgi:hypothetical protein
MVYARELRAALLTQKSRDSPKLTLTRQIPPRIGLKAYISERIVSKNHRISRLDDSDEVIRVGPYETRSVPSLLV